MLTLEILYYPIATKLSAVDGGLASMQRAEVLYMFVPHLRSQESRALAS